MYTTPQTYKEGMEEVVLWANKLEESIAKRFMLDIYKIYLEWKYIVETSQVVEKDNNEQS